MTAKRRDRIITVRVSIEEYEAWRAACPAAGARSLSEFARSAMHQLVASRNGDSTVHDQLRTLHDRVESLSTRIDRIGQNLEAVTEQSNFRRGGNQ